MKALLLCAGEGTRLRPVTNYLPKPLVPINGKPLLDYWLENLTNAGVKEFLINTHYKYEEMKHYVQKSPYKDMITLVYEEELLNTAGPIKQNKSFFDKDQPFMLVHADNLSFCDFNSFIKAHENKPKDCAMTMMLFKTDTPHTCGIVELDDRSVVQKFYEKVSNPPSNLANGAVYICDYGVLEYIKKLEKKDVDFSLDVIPNFMGKINTFLNDVYHRDIGNIESYALAQVEIYTKNLIKR